MHRLIKTSTFALANRKESHISQMPRAKCARLDQPVLPVHSPHLKFVETQHAGLLRELSRHGEDGVAAFVPHAALRGMQALVHVDHERVEVDASFAGDVWRERAVEEVHEHRLACADVAVEVEARRGISGRSFGG